MNEGYIPSPVTYALRKSLRDRLPHSDDDNCCDFLTDLPADLSHEEAYKIIGDLMNRSAWREEMEILRKLEPLDELLKIRFRSRINGILIDTRPIYYTSDDAAYETGIFEEGKKESVPMIMHGTDPDKQSFAVRKARIIHTTAVRLAEEGRALRSIYKEVLAIV